jgi:hypothetical protein
MVPYRCKAIVRYIDVNPFAGTHDVFIDTVVNDLFQKYIYAVILMGSVTEPANIHTRAHPDMFKGTQGLYFAFVIDLCCLRHAYLHLLCSSVCTVSFGKI